ncbi:MAG: oligosaccharide flippase family protein [Desulfobacterales bacterium]|nr:oligosaccharide flippase family protein [Desulfobacterales bacterium]
MDTISARPHGRQLIVGSFQGFIGSAVSLPTGIITAAFLSRQLGPELYGDLSVVCFIIIFIEAAITLGFERAAVKLTADSSSWQESATGVLQVQFIISILAALVVIAAAPKIAGWMNASDIAFYLQVYAVGIPITGMGKIHKAILIGRGHFKLKAWLDGSYWIIRLALVIFLTLVRPSVTAVLIANIISVAIVLSIARILVKPVIFRVPAGTAIAKLWLYTWPLYFFTMCIHLGKAMDLIFVRAGLPAENAGFFAAAKNLTIVPGLVTLAMTPVLLSKLSGLLVEDGKTQARDLLDKSIRFVVCLLPFAGMSAGAAGEVVQLIYGYSFNPTAPLLSVLIFGAVGLTLTQVNAAGLIAAGKTRLPLSILGPLVPLTATAYIQCITRFGTLGAALVTTVASVLTATLTALAVRRAWRVQPRMTLWAKTGVLTVVAFLAAQMWETPGVLLLVKLVLITTGIMAAWWALGELSFFSETDSR